MEVTQLAKQEFELFDVRFINWWKVVLFFQALLGCLMIGCLGTQRWVEQGEGDVHWKGSLLECYSCPGDWREKSYEKIADQECHFQSTPHLAYCDQFQSLRDAGSAFLALEILSLICLGAWTIRVLLELFNKPILPNEIAYAVPVIGAAIHLAALIQWCLVSNSFYESDCTAITDGEEKAKLCSLDGPALALTVALIYPLLAFGFFVIFSIYNQNIVTEKKPDAVTNRSDTNSFV